MTPQFRSHKIYMFDLHYRSSYVVNKIFFSLTLFYDNYIIAKLSNKSDETMKKKSMKHEKKARPR